MPALRLVAPQGRPLVLCLRAPLEHVRYRGCLPRLPPPMDFDAESQVRRVVAAFGLVYEMTCWWRSTGRWPISSESEAFLRLQIGANPVPLPQPKPRAMREHFVVPSIRSREVARAQGSSPSRHGVGYIRVANGHALLIFGKSIQ
jgi:hypothetical protein